MTSSRGSQENRKIKQNRRVDLHNIVYHMDADGRTAAAILRQYLEDHLSHKVQLLWRRAQHPGLSHRFVVRHAAWILILAHLRFAFLSAA